MPARIFCALDTDDVGEAKSLARTLKPHVAGIKLGLEFFSAHGPSGVRAVMAAGAPLFLDLKLHDIPNTVAGAVASLLPLKPQFLTIHASGGGAMIKAAAEAAKKAGAGGPKILAVTVLTSISAGELQAVGQGDAPAAQVMRLAILAKEAGADGVVCAPTEAASLRAALGTGFTLMVPGIRPVGADIGDQKRVTTPKDAVAAGADYIVIGRPITQAPDPLAMTKAINAQCGD